MSNSYDQEIEQEIKKRLKFLEKRLDDQVTIELQKENV